jgi:hypothetical protein
MLALAPQIHYFMRCQQTEVLNGATIPEPQPSVIYLRAGHAETKNVPNEDYMGTLRRRAAFSSSKTLQNYGLPPLP